IQALALKLHTEQSEARELKEHQQKLSEAAMLKWRIDMWTHSKDDVNYKFIKKIMKAGEVILYLVTNQNNQSGYWCLSLVITNKNVYSIRMHNDSYKTVYINGRGESTISGLYYMPVYTFDSPLNLTQTKSLSILSSKSEYLDPWRSANGGETSILYNLQKSVPGGADAAGMTASYARNKVNCLQAQKELESVIRLIPGSYKNGDWQPMDGFFGLYVNSSTMEINEFPGTELE
ncbi:MAG: hypothetical protein EB127_22255, partial [Alphaproteobacteria bacterium]|nr:hypothetical protein [Alphaproteobacteria bacterium]